MAGVARYPPFLYQMEISIKYRKLGLDELKNLEPEFVQFLSSNGIDAEKWVSLKKESPQVVESIVNQFSNIVFDKILDKVLLVESRSPEAIQLYKCGKDRIEMRGITAKSTGVDFTKMGEVIDRESLITEQGNDLQVMSGTKSYKVDRKLEIFDMMQKGCLISPNQPLFDYLKELTGES